MILWRTVKNEPSHEKRDPSVLRFEIFQMRMSSHSKRVRDVALCLKLPLTPFIVGANSDGAGETAQMRRLA